MARAKCEVPGELKEATIVMATGNTFQAKDAIKRKGAAFLTHAGKKFWAWSGDDCERVNGFIDHIPGIGAKTCVIKATITPRELAEGLESWYANPMHKWATSGRESRSYYADRVRERIGIISTRLGINLNPESWEGNLEKMRVALFDPDKRKKIMDGNDMFDISPHTECVEPTEEMVEMIKDGRARIASSKKYTFGPGKYDQKVKNVNKAILEVFPTD